MMRKSTRRRSTRRSIRRVSQKRSHKSARKYHKQAPKTPSKATSDMPLTLLQKMAKERGIPFGGLSKSKLAMKINKY